MRARLAMAAIMDGETEAEPSDRDVAARENMRAAQARNAARIRAQYPGKVVDRAMTMGRAERRQYLRAMRRKARKGA